MTDFDDEYVLGLEDIMRPSKAAERRQSRRDMQAEVEDLMDLYPEYEDVLNELRF